MTTPLFTPLALPNGATVPNRIAKAAMEENMATDGQLPGRDLISLYRRWSHGGTGVLITGNVMVHAQALTGPAGVVLDAETALEPFREWARAAKSGGSKVWMQINHPGRQIQVEMPGVAWAPSAIQVDLGKNSKRFPIPHAMTADEIAQMVEMFTTTAVRAEAAGFDGVEVHAAHGYLLSQFLSPISNKRDDEWGGSLENRARLLIDIVRSIRSSVSPGFVVAVKINSADFQRGGFDEDDARRVIDMLAPLGVDLVELSGGSYESPAMSGRAKDSRTVKREAYFLELAEQLAATSPLPLMLTGGIIRRSVAERVLDSGVAMVGLGTALAVDPDLPNKWRHDAFAAVELQPVRVKDKAIASALGMSRVRYQLRRAAAGKNTKPGVNPFVAYGIDAVRGKRALSRYRSWLDTERAHSDAKAAS